MPNIDTSSEELTEARQIREALATRIRAVLGTPTTDARALRRVSVPLPDDVDLLGWMRAQQASEAVYWSPRRPERAGSMPSLQPDADRGRRGGDRRAVAAVGAADVVSGEEQPVPYERLQRQMESRFSDADAAVRYYGGLRFDAPQSRPSEGRRDRWADFDAYRFVLPRFELLEGRAGKTLVCNLVLPRDTGRVQAVVESIRQLLLPNAAVPPTLPKPLGRTDRPEKLGWTQMVRWALDAISEGSLDKVVLARQVALELGHVLDPYRVLHHLKAATPRCFHFAIQPAEGPTFLGASPERLFRRTGRRVVSEAVAGTRGRGDTPEQDDALREELMNSPKERREHAFVQEAIRENLEALCTSVDEPDLPSELALARGRHLHARLTGTLRSGASTVDLLDRLHPTPAVGGVPTDDALTAIRTQEPFDRGWYAGPVGWIGPEDAEFAVAIRSGLVQSSQLTLYSGAGIVDGSVPEREWNEIEQKIGDFAAVLGLLGSENGAHA